MGLLIEISGTCGILHNLSRFPQICVTCRYCLHWYYSKGVQIVSCTLSSVSVIWESTRLFNPVLSVSANEITFDKSIRQSDFVFQLMLGLEEHYSPSQLGDINRLCCRPNWSIIQIMTVKYDLFLAATKQLYDWYFLSIWPSVTPFWLSSHHQIIVKLSEVITNDQWGPCKKSRS